MSPSYIPIYFFITAFWGICCVGIGYAILRRVRRDFPKFLAGCLITFGWIFVGMPIAITFIALSIFIGYHFGEAASVLFNMPIT